MHDPLLALVAGVALGAFLTSALLVLRERRHRRALRQAGDRLRHTEARAWAASLEATESVAVRQRAETALSEMQQQFHSAFDHAPIGVAMLGLDGRFLRVNRSLAHTLGRPSDHLEGTSLLSYTPPDDRDALTRAMQHTASGGAPVVRIEHTLEYADGRPIVVALSASLVRDEAGTPKCFVLQVQDLSEQVEHGRRLAHEANHDPLTALPNRQQFVDILGTALARRGNRPAAVLFLDLDRFQVFNDSLGHAAGDRVLATIADRLRAAAGPTDVVARFAGDEFCVLTVDDADEHSTRVLASRLLEAVARPIALVDSEVFVTASVGIALADSELTTTETLLRDATAAMHRAKELGRARTELYESATHDRAVRHLRVDRDLRRALEREELRVHYQPIMNLEDGRVCGFEALVRWEHPERGLIGPGEFVDLAEETGLIVPLGMWVFDAACRQGARWQAAGARLSMSVNLSPRQLAEPTLAGDISAVLGRTGFEPSAVCFEITETTLMRDAETAIETLGALHALGPRIAVDDFGTGFSSMSYLKRFPVDTLKVDKSFIDGLGQDPEDTAICTAIVSLAHALGLRAVAEGVETPDQLAELRIRGCEMAQGYLFGKPAPAEQFSDRPDLHRWAALAV